MLIDSVLYLWHAEVAGSTPARSIWLTAALTGLARLRARPAQTGLARLRARPAQTGLARLRARPAQTGLAQLVEHQAFNLVAAGSTPAVGTSAFLALVVEHLSCKEKALGSNPRGGIFFDGITYFQKKCTKYRGS